MDRQWVLMLWYLGDRPFKFMYVAFCSTQNATHQMKDGLLTQTIAHALDV